MRITKLLQSIPQSLALPGRQQVRNRAGGFVWGVDPMVRLERFLILGTDAPTYYASAQELTLEAASAVIDCLAEDGIAAVDRIVSISADGRAPRNDPALFALAMALKLGDPATRRHAQQAVPQVVRTLAHVYAFADAVQALGGWGRGTRRAFSAWLEADPTRLAYQAIKYRQREGWTLRDVLRKTHARPASAAHDELFAWATQGTAVRDEALMQIDAFEAAQVATRASEIVALVREHALPREAIPTRFLAERDVWEALLERLPLTAMIRSLGKLSAIGLLTTGSSAAGQVVQRLRSRKALARARVHPLALLVAQQTYGKGRGVRGKLAWRPVRAVVQALEQAFYASFDLLTPSGKRHLLALDVSGSMGFSTIGGLPGITPRVGSAAMAMATLRAESSVHTMGFATKLRPLKLSATDALDEVLAKVDAMPMGGTDCAQPMLWAAKHRVAVDAFVVYTDNETWHGGVHPSVALQRYRQAMGIDAKLIVVGMVANGFTIADPKDLGMLDVVGFDTAAPKVMANFVR